METSLDAILVADGRTGVLVDANARAETLFGRCRDELVGQHQRVLHPPGRAEEFEAVFRSHLRSGRALLPETVIRSADGSEIPVELEAGVVELESASVLAGVFRDSRTSPDERQARVRAEKRFHDLVEHAILGIYVIREGRFAYVNPKMAALFGRSREALYALDSVLETVLPDDRELVRSNLAQRETGSIQTLQYRFRGLRKVARCEDTPGGETVFDVEVRGTRSQSDPGGPAEIVGMLEDITDRLVAERELERLATVDDMTGLVNRQAMQRILREMLDGPDTQGAFVLVDLDQFTSVNESYGDAAGDQLLRQVGGILRGLNLAHTVARWGDDEFAVFLTDVDAEGAVRDADRIRIAIRSQTLDWHGNLVRATASIAVLPLDDSIATLSQLLQGAHTALRSARDAGGDQVAVFQPESDMLLRRRQEAQWQLKVRDALEDDAFLLYGQPIVPLARTGARTPRPTPPLVEVLLRLPGEHGPISAGRFIPVAERHGLIQRVDSWVLDHVIDDLDRAGRDRGGDPPFAVSVNLSPLSIESERLRSAVIERVRRSPHVAPWLRFEITETTAVRDLEGVRTFAETLGTLGCSFLLDDFGSGANSIAYLTLPVSALKIDGALIRRLVDDGQQRAVVRAYIEIAQRMGLRTIAEGVEDAQLFGHLVDLGADDVQGFAIALPRPLAEILADPTLIPGEWDPTIGQAGADPVVPEPSRPRR
jgi:diguanylate cyclase (GGDEF)-like protein/PAS domain S-box-containing protein